MTRASWSLRVRLVAATAAALALVFALTGTALFAAMRASLRTDFDENLALKVRALSTMTELQGKTLFVDTENGQLAEFVRKERPQYYQVWQTDGGLTEVARSPSLADGAGLAALAAGDEMQPVFHDGRLPDGRAGRYVAMAWPVYPEHDERVDRSKPPVHTMAVVGAGTAEVDRAVAQLGLLLLGGCAGATVVAVSVVGWLIGHGLRRVDRVAAAIADVGHERLADRLSDEGVPAELRPVVGRINELLARLQETFARERALTADVAHELRTPLAGIRAALEVSGGRRREPAEYERTIARCLTTLDGLQAMVDNLLRLARLEAGQGAAAVGGAVDVGELLRARWVEYETRGSARGLTVRWTAAEAGLIAAVDGDALRVIVDNLFDNAVSYADAGGWVRVSATARDGAVRFEVANSGSELTAEQARNAFERFWRGDASRTATGLHCGLGLTLVRRIVDRFGGRADARSSRGGEFAVSVEVPAAPGVDAPAAVEAGSPESAFR